MLRIYDTAGLQGNVQLPRHYLLFADAFVLVYDPSDPASLDLLAGIKSDIDKYKDKKEVRANRVSTCKQSAKIDYFLPPHR